MLQPIKPKHVNWDSVPVHVQTVWSSDAKELTMQAIVVNNKHQNDKLLLMSRYITVFHISFWF